MAHVSGALKCCALARVAPSTEVVYSLPIRTEERAASVEKIWLQHYPPGVRAEIDPDEFGSLNEVFARACETFASSTAFSNMNASISYAQLEVLTRAFAAWLQQKSGLQRGDRIAIMLPNLLQYPVALFGALRAGLVVVNTNPMYTATELEHQLADSGARAIVILENFAHVLEGALARTRIEKVLVTAVGDLLGFPRGLITNAVLRYVHKKVPRWHIAGALRFKSTLAAGLGLDFQAVTVGPADIAFLQYTGGTTGVSKAAMLTHRNMVANVLQSAEMLCAEPLPAKDRTAITALPLYHIFSLAVNGLLFMHLGARNLLITNPRDFRSFVADLRRNRFQFISGVNTLFNGLLHTEGFDQVDFSALRITMGGGMAVQKAVADEWKRVTGCPLSQGWGLTETSPVVTVNPPDLEFNDSIGLPLPSTEVSVRDEDGNDLGVGKIGELCVRGPQVMAGYWNRPDETAKVMHGDWLRTGDIGHMDKHGFVFIEDRKKDMILVSGFNVYPNEVEGVAAEMPDVLECAAVAQPDAHSDEVVALFVVKKNAGLTAEAITTHCRSKLTAYKVPKHIYFRDELPKSNVGKILRRVLRDELRSANAAR